MLLVCALTVVGVLSLDLGLMVMVVSLEDRCLVTCSSTNTIVVAHYLSELIKGLEDVDTNTTIETCRFE